MNLIEAIHTNIQFNGLLKMLARKMSFTYQYEDFKQSVLVEVWESNCATIEEAETCAQRVAKRFYKEHLATFDDKGEPTNQSYDDNINYSPDDYDEPILSDEAYNSGGFLNLNKMLKDVLMEMGKQDRMYCVKNKITKDSYFVANPLKIPINRLHDSSMKKVGVEWAI